MNTLIETPFFFFHHTFEKFSSITLTKKFTYIIAPSLPILSLILLLIQLPYFYNLSKWYLLLPLVALVFTVLLLTASINFQKGKNIFLISHLNLIYKESFKSFKNSTEYILSTPIKNIITIKIPTVEKEKTQKQVNMFTFNATHDTIIKEALQQLKKEIINDSTTVEDFKKAMQNCILKQTGDIYPTIKLELQSQHCAMFLESLFIPLVQLFTLNKATLKESCRYFQYAKAENHSAINYDSINKTGRKLITNAHKETYSKVLENVKSQLAKKTI